MLNKIISKKTQSNLELLKKAKLLDGFYLAGGTGLALQLEHRLSMDLDFFSPKNINTQSLKNKLQELGDLSVTKEDRGTLNGIFNETEIMFLEYPYSLLYPMLFCVQEEYSIPMADTRDIGCMKISSVSGRGTRKDFIDLYFICKDIIPFEELLKLFKKKYENIDYNLTHILKSLIYFEDAEEYPMPKMLIPVDWKEVKRFFQNKVKVIEK